MVSRRRPASVASAKADESRSSWSTSGRSALLSILAESPAFFIPGVVSGVFSSGRSTAVVDGGKAGSAAAACVDRWTPSGSAGRRTPSIPGADKPPTDDGFDRTDETDVARARSSIASSADLRPAKAAKASGAWTRQSASRMSSVPSRSFSVQNWYWIGEFSRSADASVPAARRNPGTSWDARRRRSGRRARASLE